MDAQTWQANALVALDHIAEQRALSEPVNTAAIEDLLSVYDDVVFDFSLESSSSSSSATAAVSSTSTGSRSAASGLRMSWYNLVVGDVTDAVHTVDLTSPSTSPLSATAATTTTSSGNSAGFVAAGLRASFGGSSSNCSSPVDRNADADWERLDYDSDADEGQGLDIEAVRQWCMDRAGSGERQQQQQQSVFRFEYGRYASAEARRRLVVVG